MLGFGRDVIGVWQAPWDVANLKEASPKAANIHNRW